MSAVLQIARANAYDDDETLDAGVVKLTRYTYVAVLTKLTKEFGPTRLSQAQVWMTTAEIMTKVLRRPFTAEDVRRHLGRD